jgi:hypothetical protein
MLLTGVVSLARGLSRTDPTADDPAALPGDEAKDSRYATSETDST